MKTESSFPSELSNNNSTNNSDNNSKLSKALFVLNNNWEQERCVFKVVAVSTTHSGLNSVPSPGRCALSPGSATGNTG